MLLILLSVFLLIFAIALLLCDNVSKEYSYLATYLSVFIAAFLIVRLLDVKFNENENYEKMLHQKITIEQRIENTEDVETLYEEIEEFNNKIEKHKKYCDNLWFNSFYSKKIATIDYIQIKTFTQEAK